MASVMMVSFIAGRISTRMLSDIRFKKKNTNSNRNAKEVSTITIANKNLKVHQICEARKKSHETRAARRLSAPPAWHFQAPLRSIEEYKI